MKKTILNNLAKALNVSLGMNKLNVRLVPGFNYVEEEIYNEIMSHKSAKNFIERHESAGHLAISDRVETSKKKKVKVGK